MPFFTPTQKENLEKWNYRAVDNSISTKLLNPFWNWVVSLVPDDVAPNILSLAGLLCIIHSYYLTYLYGTTYPGLVCILSACLLFAYQTLDAIDGKHARKTQNSSPLGELFDHVCDNIGIVFIVMTITECLNAYGFPTITGMMQWHLMHIFQYSFLSYHLEAYKRKVLEFPEYTGPGEVLLGVVFMLITMPIVSSMIIDNSLLVGVFKLTLGLLPHVSTAALCYLGYKILQTPYSTRNGLSICLLYHLLPKILLGYYNLSSGKGGLFDVSKFEIITDGIFLSVLTSDMIVAKMANRDLHAWIPMLAGFSVLNPWISLGLTMAYYIGVFSELCNSLNLYMFTINRNVYVDGVYDLCHLGHKNLFKNALQFGNRLIVGVMSDEDCIKYKRAPIMTLKERVDAVAACKGVYKVVPGAPCFGLTEEFLKEHKIHVVAHSTEYDKEDDKYYDVPRKMGMTRVLPRTEGMSTSELLNRIKATD